jgi:N-acetylmuramoyl-L-alanine amidase
MRNNVYILDPGHGGINPQTGHYVTAGKRSPIWDDGSQFFEGVGNRQIVKLLAEKLKNAGIKVEFTVSPDTWEDVSLSKRCVITNEIYKKANRKAVFISIHSNASDNEKAEGYEVFSSVGYTTSDKYAQLFLNRMEETFPTNKNRGAKEVDFYVLVNTLCPAILIESMFHTNRRECAILQSESGRDKIATALFNMILDIENEPIG